MPEDPRERVERLLEGIVADAELRAAFRRDPVGLCLTLELPGLAGALARRRRGLQTLEVRESRSPLAGALAAAAAEIAGAVDLAQAAPGPGPGGDATPPGPHTAGVDGFGPTGGGAPIEGPRADLYRRGTFPAVTPDRQMVGTPPAPPTKSVEAAVPAPAAAPAPAPAVDAQLPAPVPPASGSTLGGLAAVPGQRPTLGRLAAAGPGGHSTLGGGGVMGEFALDGAGPPAGMAAVAEAQTLLGTPYLWGGDSPGGFDCSGLLQYVYARLGVSIPRVAADQAAAGVPVPDPSLLEPGDIVYFDDGTGPIHHVGMYVGGGSFIQAPHEGDVVKISSLDDPGYASRYAGARRVAPGPAVLAPAAPFAAPSGSTLGGLPAAPSATPGGPPTLGGLPAAQAPMAGSGSTLGGLVSAPAPSAIATAIDPALLPYPGDGAPPEAVARWMAAAAAGRGLPPELPVMASLAETGLRNLPYGDRDSLGLFQQRPSQGWGTPEQVMDPYHALGIFLDRAAATDVGGRFSSLGPAGLGTWCQAVQISGFPERFLEQLPRAQALLAQPIG